MDKDQKFVAELTSNWDIDNSLQFTNKIYTVVEKHKVRAAIKAKPGSLELVVTVVLGSYPILKDIMKWVRKHREQRELPRVKVRIIRKLRQVTEEEI